MTPAVDISNEYDADQSASLEETLAVHTTRADAGDEVRPEPVHTATASSPVLSETATEQSMVEESLFGEEQGSDVFGPSSIPVKTKASKRKGRKAKRKFWSDSTPNGSTAYSSSCQPQEHEVVPI